MNIFSSSQGRDQHNHHTSRPHASGRLSPRPLSSSAAEPEIATEKSFTKALMSALFALPITAIIGLLLLLIVTAVAYGSPDPDALTTPLALGTLGLTSLLGGLVAARRGVTQPILCGLLSGLLFTLLLLGVSLFFGDEAKTQLSLGISSPVVWVLHGGVVLLSVLGGKLGGKKKVKTPSHSLKRK